MSRHSLPDDDFSHLPKVDDVDAPDRDSLRQPSPTPDLAPATQPEPEAAPEPVVQAAPLPPEPAPRTPRIRLKVKPTPRPPPPPEPTPEPTPEPLAKASEPEAKADIAKPEPVKSSVADQAKEEPTSAEKDKPEVADKNETDHHLVIRPPGAEEKHKDELPPLTRKEELRALWVMIGGRYLAYSVGIHALILVVAAVIVINTVSERHVDFLPGGGTSQGEAAEKSLSETVKQKHTPWLKKNPLQRVASSNLVSDIKLPEPPMEMISIPDISRNKMDTMGFGTAGAGGGFGSGIGTGGKSGVTFQPIMMFGKSINARRMAVILDVSSSMTDYLDGVVKEVDRVAKGSPVVCYFGCGLMRPENGKHIDDKIDLCKNPSFERFWRVWYGPAPFNSTPEEIKKIKFGPKDRIPLEEVYLPLAKRPNTYFVDFNGIVYAWTALVNDLVRNADALYWFSDFMDDVEDKEIKIVLENLKRRKQRLYIHPSIHGSSFEQVKNGLVIPTGGDVIEPLK